jgi:hypothetical protein
MESWIVSIPTESWVKENVKLSNNELEIVKKDPKNLDNIVNFYTFFDKLNLLSVWDYRDELVNAIWIREINNKDDSLTVEEIRKFWNKLLSFIANIWKPKWEPKENIELNSINSVNQEFKKFSWANSFISDEKTYNIEWEDKLAAYLRDYWIIWWAYFNTNKFREAIN